MRDIVTFDSVSKSLPAPDEMDRIARRVIESLPGLGIAIRTSNREDTTCWLIGCEIDGNRVTIDCGDHGARHSKWQIAAYSKYGWLSRKFGKDDDPSRSKITQALHQILTTDSQLTNFQWFARSEYDSSTSTVGSPTP